MANIVYRQMPAPRELPQQIPPRGQKLGGKGGGKSPGMCGGMIMDEIDTCIIRSTVTS